MAPRSQVIFAVGYTVLLIGGLAAFWLPRPSAAEWPAWVQAVGSVLAIIVAIWISKWEGDRTRNDRLQERQEFRRSVAGLARRLADRATSDAEDMLLDPTFYIHEGLDTSEYRLLDAALARFEPAKLESADGVVALEDLRRLVANAGYWARALGEEYRQEVDHADLTGSIRKWSDRAQALAVRLDSLAEEK